MTGPGSPVRKGGEEVTYQVALNDRGRDIGYGVPAACDQPGCGERIDRGINYRCGGILNLHDQAGCGLFFCHDHLQCPHSDSTEVAWVCARCSEGLDPFEPTADLEDWIATS